MTLLALSILALALFPDKALAMTFVQVAGVFNLFVGLFLVAIVLTFGSGVFVYFVRLDTWPSHRDTAIEVMEWGLAMLFILIVILGLVQFFQRHSGIALSILAFLLVVVVAFFILRAAAQSSKKEKKPPQRGAPRA